LIGRDRKGIILESSRNKEKIIENGKSGNKEEEEEEEEEEDKVEED